MKKREIECIFIKDENTDVRIIERFLYLLCEQNYAHKNINDEDQDDEDNTNRHQ